MAYFLVWQGVLVSLFKFPTAVWEITALACSKSARKTCSSSSWSGLVVYSVELFAGRQRGYLGTRFLSLGTHSGGQILPPVVEACTTPPFRLRFRPLPMMRHGTLSRHETAVAACGCVDKICPQAQAMPAERRAPRFAFFDVWTWRDG